MCASGAYGEVLIMIPARWLPCRRIVACLTIRRERCGGMVRIVRVVVVLLVTADARHRGPGIHAVDVARSTWCGDMRPGQRESCCTVIEGGRFPSSGCMTDRTIHRERGLRVLRRDYAVIVFHVTARAD